MDNFFIIVIGSYAIGSLGLVFLWQKFTRYKPARNQLGAQPLISILLPVRNESKNLRNILQDIANQTYSLNNFELIIVNDASTDDTLSIAEDAKENANFKIKIISLPEVERNLSPKKRAITTAINQADGELIITTDGDCRVPKNWISTIANYYKNNDAFFISSPVTFIDNKNNGFISKMMNALQIIEFGSLVGSAACAIKLGRPNMCSGANIAYTKAAFLSVNGFEGNETIASGDDEFLMHKITGKYPGKVHFLKSKEVIITTESHTNFKSFYQQRKRWASKWRFYTDWQTTALAVYIALTNGIAAWALLSGNWKLICLKFVFEFFFLLQIMNFLNKKWTVGYIFLTQLIYPFYVLFFTIVSQFKSTYVWKGRVLK